MSVAIRTCSTAQLGFKVDCRTDLGARARLAPSKENGVLGAVASEPHKRRSCHRFVYRGQGTDGTPAERNAGGDAVRYVRHTREFAPMPTGGGGASARLSERVAEAPQVIRR